MARTIQFSGKIEILSGGAHSHSTVTFDKTFTVTAITYDVIVVAANATKIIWDPTTAATEATSDFDFLFMQATKDLDVEMTINEGDANEELNSFRLVAGVPFVLGADDAWFNHGASDIFANTASNPDVIDKIRIDEPNGVAAELILILGT